MDNGDAFIPEKPGKPEDAAEIPARFALQHHDATASSFNVIGERAALIQTADKRGNTRHGGRLDQVKDEHL
jgi:hypothetical protein